MSWDTVLFDLDGTLTDPKPGITGAFAYAMRHYGMEADPDSLTGVIGPPLKDSFMEICGFDEARALEAIWVYREYFSEKGWAENAVYPGIPELLSALKKAGMTLAVATSKPEHFSVRILDHFGLSGYFDLICGAPMDESDAGKKENVIKKALETLEIPELSRAVMVGDRRHDIYGAKVNGLASIGVLFGYGSREELTDAGADYLAESVDELGKLLIYGG
ncbi:MAG: HAD family hydrolase [Clostridia bacterium]|nr:HAD family hydrolase [Clostridia bacterium]